jgi:hypothetical protein
MPRKTRPRGGIQTGFLNATGEENIVSESPMTLTAEEHEFLVSLLKFVLKNALVEEHRTRALSYREHVLHKEELVAGLLKKLGQPTA